MDELEQKLGNILNDPKMMQQIMSMAQAMGGQNSEPPQAHEAPPQPSADLFSSIDMGTIRKISNLAQNSNIDKRERALLQALGAYLSKDRIAKLEKAMRAAKIAKIASATIGQQGAPSSAGR